MRPKNNVILTLCVLLSTVIPVFFLSSCKTLDKLAAGEPLLSGNITETKNTREGGLAPNEGNFLPEWLQGDWAVESDPGILGYTITPNEIRYLGKIGLLETYKDALMEDQGYTLEYFVTTDEEALFELEAGADDQYRLFVRAVKEDTGVTVFIWGMNEEKDTKLIPYKK